LQKPIMAIAPMANVTDAAFRRMFAKYGQPDVMWTEFVSVEGLLSEGRSRLLPDLWFTEAERPIVAQIFGNKPEQFERVAAELVEMGFDGIDINMGCPDKGVERSGGGAALIREPELARQVIRATKRGAPGLPVSVKTRLGYNKMEYKEWLPQLLEEDIAALTVHLRTRKEMSLVSAHWEIATDIVSLRDKHAPQTPILGNGDITTLEDAKEKIRASGMDGTMVGRGIFGNPWFFSGHVPEATEKLRVMVEHTRLFEELYKSNSTDRKERLKNFEVMKKHYKAYANGFAGAKELRAELMEAEDSAGVHRITEDFLAEYTHDQ